MRHRTSARRGSLDPDTAILVDRSLRFGELTAEDLMTPRVRVTALGPEDTVDELLRVAADTGHSRFPVCRDGDLDNLVGVVHVKQAFSVPHKELRTTRLDSLMWTVATVPASLDGDSVVEYLAVGGLDRAGDTDLTQLAADRRARDGGPGAGAGPDGTPGARPGPR